MLLKILRVISSEESEARGDRYSSINFSLPLLLVDFVAFVFFLGGGGASGNQSFQAMPPIYPSLTYIIIYKKNQG